MSKELSERGYFIAASDLGVDVATIKAVAEVESAGDGFTADGRVKILFERHKFHSLTHGQFDSDPDISNRTAGGYGAAGAHQYARFSKAFALDADAAMKSASWGKFQIMGFNHKAAGFDTVGAFVDAMKVSEDEQLKAFVNVIKSFGLAGELRNHDWAGFARQYNGMGYKKNRYDTKMAAAYRKFSSAKVETHLELDANNDKGTTTSPDKLPSETSGTPPPAPAVEVKPSQPGLISKVTSLSIPAGASAIIGGIYSFTQHIPPWGWAILGGVFTVALIIAAWLFNESLKRAQYRTEKLMQAAADPEKNNLRLV